MVERNFMLLVSWSIVMLLVLIGCGPGTTSQIYPDLQWTVENPLASRGASKGSAQLASRDTARAAPTSSSLDALRRGESPATPASSPLKDIYFEFDRYDLTQDAREILKANAEWLKQNPSQTVQIEGHCDERGSNEYNMGLGAKRAQTAKEFLMALGIPPERMSTVTYGEEIPVCSEHEEACWAKNRRDRFVIVSARPVS